MRLRSGRSLCSNSCLSWTICFSALDEGARQLHRADDDDIPDIITLLSTCVVMVSFLSAANCSYSSEANVLLNVTPLSHLDLIVIIPYPVEKRSGCQISCVRYVIFPVIRLTRG